MSCFLCGHDEEGRHHLGCMRPVVPHLTEGMAVEMGLLPRPRGKEVPVPAQVEVLVEGSMTTVPVSNSCGFEGCDNPKFSDSPRAKYCEEHRDPKNRKE